MQIHTRTRCMTVIVRKITDIVPIFNPNHPNQHPNHNLLVNNP